MSDNNDSININFLEKHIINQSQDITSENNQVPLEPLSINTRNQQYILNVNINKPSDNNKSKTNTAVTSNNQTRQQFMKNNNPNQVQSKEIFIGNAQQQQMMQQNFQNQNMNQQGQFFNPQMQGQQMMGAQQMGGYQMMGQQPMMGGQNMMLTPQQQMAMQQRNMQQMQMQQNYKPPVELTQEEIARRKRREEEKKKFARHIPQENKKNMDVEGGYQKTLYECGEWCGCLGQYCFCCENPNVQVNNSYKGIYERFGKYVETVESGLHFVNPCSDKLIQMDMKTQNIDLGMQQSITADNILLFVHGVVQYRVIDCRQAYYSIDNINFSVKELSICALRSTISQFKFQELLDNRDMFRRKMEDFVDEYIHDWGVDVEQIIIKDMNMDPNTQQNLASAAKEARLAQAKILNAKADVAAAEEQRKAADQLASKSAMQIRFLSTLERIASRSKVVFLGDH